MTAKELTAFGMIFKLEESTIEKGFEILDKLREEKVAPIPCIMQLGQQLELTSAVATALYAEWQSQHKPIF